MGSAKLLFWMNMPSHHQSAFFDAIRRAGLDLVVYYYGQVSAERRTLGWDTSEQLARGESHVKPRLESLSQCADWRDRVHVVPGYGTPFTRKLARYLSAEGVRWVHWSEAARSGFRWWLSYPIKRWYAGLVNKYALGAFGISKLAREDFSRWGIRDTQIRILPYAIEGISEQEQQDQEIDTFVQKRGPVFIYIGRLEPLKGVDTLMKAFRIAAAQCPLTCLVLVGPDLMKGEYQKLAQTLGIKDKVLFRGVLPAARIGSALKCGDILILPSRYDGWGMVLSEAASVGKALIATEACGGAHHLIVEGENGFRVPPNNASSLAHAMLAYTTDPGLAHRHGRRSQELFAEYTPDRNVQRLVQGLTEFESGSMQ